MNLKDRRLILVGGAGVALAAGLVIAVIVAMRPEAADEAPSASVGGLVVQKGLDDGQKLDPTRPLSCFVDGRLAGQMTVSACARKNGVAAGALDVGVDASGGLTATKAPDGDVIPPPPAPPADEQTASAADQTPAPAEADGPPSTGPVQPCWSYSGGNWSRAAASVPLGACVQSLFAGQCVGPGAAVYGRWGGRTLRLVMGRVEMSNGDHAFRTLSQQQGGCAIPDAQ